MATAAHPRPTFISGGPIFAILAATIPGLVEGAITNPGTHIATVAVGAVTLVLSTFGLVWAERQPGNRALYGVLAGYTVGVGAAIWISHGAAFLVAMPLVSVFVLYLPFRVALGLTFAVMVWLASALSVIVTEPSQLIQGTVSTSSAFAFVIVFSLVARRERYARRDLLLQAAELEALATSRERNRIAREIHDSLGHYLTVAHIQLEAARTSADGRDARIVRAQELLKDGLGELRRSVSMLREGPLPPFTSAIAALIAECNDTGLAAELTTAGVERAVAGSVGYTLYRAAQEALTNVRRHAKANKVAVALDYQKATVTLRVTDDGVGATGREGNGLAGLRERVELAGGSVKLEKPAAGGFALIVEVPA
jgi:signal transduction histidine kinase